MFFFVPLCLLFSSFTAKATIVSPEILQEIVMNGGEVVVDQKGETIIVKVRNNGNNSGNITITDSKGKTVRAVNFTGNTTIRINTSNYVSGSYSLTAFAGGDVASLQFKK